MAGDGGHYANDRIGQFNQAVRTVAADTGTALVDCFEEVLAGDHAALLHDGLHPNGAGHQLLAHRIVVTQVLGVLFDGPGMVARDALVPRVAREDDVPLVRATSLQETLQNTAQFVGPLAAGLLIAAVAEQGTLLVAAVMFAAAMALIAGLERQRLRHDQPLTAASALADVRQGFRFIVTEPLLGPLTWLLVAWVAV
jgi:GDSL-like Lipase/Acylhydrolase family